MAQSLKIPLVITKNSFSIKLTGKTAEALLEQPRPILWCNNGLYCWICSKTVRNQARVIKDHQTHASANDLPYKIAFVFDWNVSGTRPFFSFGHKEMAQAIEEMSDGLRVKCGMCGPEGKIRVQQEINLQQSNNNNAEEKK